ncbi:MAG: TolC family protein, partial [Pedobacter sp.]
MKNNRYSIFFIGFVLLTLSACVTTKYNRPEVKSDNLYRDSKTTDSTTIATLPWR